MKLIIDIPEHCFEELKCVELNESNEGVVFHAIKCILNGIPLDNIGAEIEDLMNKTFPDDGEYYEGRFTAYKGVLEIINKHIGDTE